MADAAGHQAHQDFLLARTFHFELFDSERAPWLAQHGGANRDQQ